jgi:hypothetical protein
MCRVRMTSAVHSAKRVLHCETHTPSSPARKSLPAKGSGQSIASKAGSLRGTPARRRFGLRNVYSSLLIGEARVPGSYWFAVGASALTAMAVAAIEIH